jgi:hypothetical protein
MITPSNGRIVWYTPSALGMSDNVMVWHDPFKPLAAVVCHVWGDRMVNLLVIDSDGTTHARTSVNLLQDDDPVPEHGRFCVWMPLEAEKAKG